MHQALYDHLINLGFPEHFAVRIANEPQAKSLSVKPHETAEDWVSFFAVWSTTPEGTDFWGDVCDRVANYGPESLATVEIPQ